jgi:hypothetical protein
MHFVIKKGLEEIESEKYKFVIGWENALTKNKYSKG